MSRYIDADALLEILPSIEDEYKFCRKIISEQPTADVVSKEKWIPCSERMPEPSEDGKSFLVTVSEIRSYNTNGDFYKKEDRRVTIELFVFKDGNGWFAQSWYDKAKIIAWMPLAEPFNDGRMETEHLSKCPKCGEYTSVKSGACEYCGARMDERREARNE